MLSIKSCLICGSTNIKKVVRRRGTIISAICRDCLSIGEINDKSAITWVRDIKNLPSIRDSHYLNKEEK